MSTVTRESPNRSMPYRQFSIAALLWATFVVALALAYLRQFDSAEIMAAGAIVMAAAVAVGVLVGAAVGRIGDAVYWSVVISAAAYLSVAGDLAAPAMFRHAWSAVGIMAGAVGGAVAPGQLGRRILGGALAASVAMAGCSQAMPNHDLEWIFDLICAPIVGGLVGILIEWVRWLEQQRYSPRYITAAWLLCAVIVGNLLVPLVLA